ncbi:MAG: endonuclease III domain-containing protein [Methanomicrobiales archaeon]
MRKFHHIIEEMYYKLYDLYGPQGWWPLTKYNGANPNKIGSIMGYHPKNYDIPVLRNDIYEVILGSILTQNTSWIQAQKAVLNLNELNAIVPERLLNLDEQIIKSQIKCAGFLNQKAMYLKEITKFFIKLKGRSPTRKELLDVKGVGNETADTILLYAYKKPEFVVDTYTKRIFTHLGMVDEHIGYLQLKELFESSLPENFKIYNEYHALIVEHAKRYYKKKPYGENDPLKKMIKNLK